MIMLMVEYCILKVLFVETSVTVTSVTVWFVQGRPCVADGM